MWEVDPLSCFHAPGGEKLHILYPHLLLLISPPPAHDVSILPLRYGWMLALRSYSPMPSASVAWLHWEATINITTTVTGTDWRISSVSNASKTPPCMLPHYHIPLSVLFSETACPSVFWTVALALLRVLPSSLFWVSCHMSRTFPFPKWLSLVRFPWIRTSKTHWLTDLFVSLFILKCFLLRSRFGLHSLSSRCHHNAFPTSVGILLLYHDCLSGTRQSGEANILKKRERRGHLYLPDVWYFQFVCLESLVTAVMDMYPSTFRRKNARELLILAIAVVTYLLGLIMVTEVCLTWTDVQRMRFTAEALSYNVPTITITWPFYYLCEFSSLWYKINNTAFLHRGGFMSFSSLITMQLAECACSLWEYVRLFALLGFMVGVLAFSKIILYIQQCTKQM